MLAVLSGGGTAGHINPAIALADELARRGHSVQFAGTPTGVEARLVAEAGIPFTPFEASGFNRRHPLSLVKGVRTIARSTKQAKAWFEQISPDVVVAFGGYVCLPVGRAAAQTGVPLVIHEQNSVMGMANKSLAKSAHTVCLTYEHASVGLDSASRVVITGNPVRASVLSATRQQGRELLGIPDDALMLLVFGGSLGARHINQAIGALKERLLALPHLYIVQVTGPKEFDSVKEMLNLTPEQEKRWLLFDYQNQMGNCLAAADVVVARSGATSLAEISALAVPAVLVPFPYATEDHQTTNARAYVDAGCAALVADADVESETFASCLFDLLEHPEKRERMACAARAQKTRDAGMLLADAVIAAAQHR